MHTEAQIFIHFILQFSVLELWLNIGKMHRMTKNDLVMFRAKGTHMYSRYIPEAQTFVRVAL